MARYRDLDSDVPHPLFHQRAGAVGHLGEIAAARVRVHVGGLPALASQQIVHAHAGPLALISHNAMSTPESALLSTGPLRQYELTNADW